MVLPEQLALHVRRFGWNGTIHVVLKQRLQFRPAFVEPLVPGSNAPAIEHYQRVGQGRLRRQRGKLGERAIGSPCGVAGKQANAEQGEL